MTSAEKDPRGRRFVHLGDRLLALGRIRSGIATIDNIADEYGLEPADVVAWIDAHGGDRLVSLDELRMRVSPELRSLALRAQRLADLVAQAERSIRDLHQEYILNLAASNDPFASAKEFDDFTNSRNGSVVPRQP